MKPVHNNVVVKQVQEEQKQYGNILIPDMDKEAKTIKAEVLAIGPGLMSMNNTIIPMQVKVGDVIIFQAFSGIKIFVEGEEYITLKDQDIILKLNEK